MENDIKSGSSKHYTGVIPLLLTKHQFRTKGRRLYLLAKKFIDDGKEPPGELRQRFTPGEIDEMKERNRDKRTTLEKVDAIHDPVELFVFFKYYDGFKSNGTTGFDPNAGPPGSINHFRSVHRLTTLWDGSQFRCKGKLLASVAKECLNNNVIPPENLRPASPPPTDLPWGMMEAALRA